ncbi:MAG: hypothetical protein H0X26_01935 [Alphaproteobacteria bacterium]|nr:hypothetical protein [Alphaproteobacteria bacterium]
MKIFNFLLVSGLFFVGASLVPFEYAHSENITAEKLIENDTLNHNEKLACSCIDPRCR